MRRHTFALACRRAAARHRLRGRSVIVGGPACACRRRSGPVGHRGSVARSDRRRLHRLLPVCVRRLDGGQSDAGRSAALGPVQPAAGRQFRDPAARSSKRPGSDADPRKGGRILRRVHGRERHRSQGPAPLERGARADRRDRRGRRICRRCSRTCTASASTCCSASAPTRICTTRPGRSRTSIRAASACPDRDYYLKTDARSLELKQKYQDHVQKMLGLLTTPRRPRRPADARAVLAIETALAQASLDRTARRDPAATDHMMARADWQALTPAIDWSKYRAAAGAPAVRSASTCRFRNSSRR